MPSLNITLILKSCQPLIYIIYTSILPMSTFLYSLFISLTPSFMASTVVFVSLSCWMPKFACSMLNDWFLSPSNWLSYILFCFSTLKARCFTMFYNWRIKISITVSPIYFNPLNFSAFSEGHPKTSLREIRNVHVCVCVWRGGEVGLKLWTLSFFRM